MEMKEIVYNKSCNACGSEYIVVEIEELAQEADANLPIYRIKLRCNKCNEIVEIMDVYRNKIQVTVNQNVEDIFDATKEEELKCELADLRESLERSGFEIDELTEMHRNEVIKNATLRSLLMDIYKLSNKGGNRNA